MKSTVMLLTISVISSVALSLALGQTEPTGRIKGHVLDLFGNPLSGAEVVISPGNSGEKRFITDLQGGYEVMGLVPGSYSVTASLRGFHTAKSRTYLV